VWAEPEEEGQSPAASPEAEEWSLHLQVTGIYQGYPSFPARYSGAHSLTRHAQIRETVTATGFLGRRLWPGAAVYVNPEFFQGLGFNGTFGVAGFPNGEATKAGSVQPNADMARYFLRQVIGLGGPQEWIAGVGNQLAGYQDIARLTFTIGRLAAPDLFDGNQYSHDPRTQFWNWALWEGGAWDFAADARGYTDGVVAELNHRDWALRYGAFLPPRNPNGKHLPFHGLDSLSQNLELEERYHFFPEPGTVRVLGFYTRARMGNFSQALRLSGDINENISKTRHYGHEKYGFIVNVEQALTAVLGGFFRFSWNDGATEDWAFTQIDQSLALGLSLQGQWWGRPEDTVGVAGAVNELSAAHRRFLAAGGLGLIIGDGRLAYASEGVFETDYQLRLLSGVSLAIDYQFLPTPAYNTDRGPVHVFGIRLHVEY
jgi:high affinity Mn2+ porin